MAFIPDAILKCSENVRRLWELADPCTLCPRKCRVCRGEGQVGYCGIYITPKVSSIGPHFGEESVLVGERGSGTIFFAGCNLTCIFCQNYDISHERQGRKMPVEQIVQTMLDLQNHGCSNINFVTPTHVIHAIAAAIESAKDKGLKIPTVYNSGGYDSVETLKLLEGLVDIYMPDMKYSDPKTAGELSDAPDYPEINFAAVKEMHRQVGDLKIKKGVAARGLLVRHLVLPENLAGSCEIIDSLAKEISPKTTINVMSQYRPCYHASTYPRINHRPTHEEIYSAKQYAIGKGLLVLD